MTTFTDAWNATYEGQPADNEDISLGAGRIRSLKLDVRERMAVDHSWDDGLTVASNDGKHNQATLRVQTAAPTLDTGDGAIYSFVIAGITELFYKDSSGNVTQITSAGQLNFIAAPGDFGVVGNLSVDGVAGVIGEITSGGAIIATTEVIGNQIGPIGGNSDFFMAVDGSGNPAIAFGQTGVLMIFNVTSQQFEFYIASALVGHIP